MSRFAHAHEHHLAHRAALACEHRLGDDLGAAKLALQTVAAAHAEHTPHSTTHLRRNAQPATRQQHALHHLPVDQFHQQSCDAFSGGVFTAQARQSMQFRFNGGQLIAQCKRKESLCGAVRSIVRANLTPAAQQTIFVARLGTEITQVLAEVGDTHGRVRGGNQSKFANTELILPALTHSQPTPSSRLLDILHVHTDLHRHK
jgi:hypothetical protein